MHGYDTTTVSTSTHYNNILGPKFQKQIHNGTLQNYFPILFHLTLISDFTLVFIRDLTFLPTSSPDTENSDDKISVIAVMTKFQSEIMEL